MSNLSNIVKQLITMLDKKVEQQLHCILTNSDFVSLQASWAGIQYICDQLPNSSQVKVKLLDVSWAQLRNDLLRSANIEQTSLYAKLNDQAIGIAGGEPIALLLGDYELDFNHVSNSNSYDDLMTLRTVAGIAAASFTIFVSSVKASNFGLDTYGQISGVSALSIVLNVRDQRLWQQFRRDEVARFVCLLLPRMLINSHYENNVELSRAYYSKNSNIWTNSVYPYAASFIHSFLQTNWFLDALGMPNHQVPSLAGVARDLVAPKFISMADSAANKNLTEIFVTAYQEEILNEQGFTVLEDLQHSGQAGFVNGISIKQTKQQENSVSAEQLACVVPYLLCVCRFAHYLKIIGRNKLGKYQNTKQCENDLQTWLNNYVASNTDISTEMKLRFPLNAGSVKVLLQKGSQEHYICVMNLRPQVRTNQASANIKLKTAIAQLI